MTIPLKICLLSKYPPMEGGLSKTSYWLARRLAERGHEVHVVTDAFHTPADYRLYLEPEDWKMLSCDLGAEGGGRVVLTEQVARQTRSGTDSGARRDLSALAALAIEAIERQGAELVFSQGLEPYAVAGQLAASLTGLPHVVHPIGGDLPQSPRFDGLLPLHGRVLTAADCVLTDDAGRQTLADWGLQPQRLAMPAGDFCPPEYFHPAVEPLDVTGLLAGLPGDPGTNHERIQRWNPAPFRSYLPTIGVYGKVGANRGSYDLLDALARLRTRGLRFNLLAMLGGPEIHRFRHEAAQRGLRDHVWFLPFLPHWRVPSFIRTCDAVCYLERGARPAPQYPAVPREVMACGVCLVLSGEAAAGSWASGKLRDPDNLILVPNPRDTRTLAAQLRRVIEDPVGAAEIGLRGHRACYRQDDDRLAAADQERALLWAMSLHRSARGRY